MTALARPRPARGWLGILAACTLVVSAALAPAARAQTPGGVTVAQGYGFATVAWEAVDGAGSYQIERTPLDGDDPAGPAQVVGVWQPARYTDGALTFADSGFVLGERYRWRVRAVVGGTPGEWSEAAHDDTLALVGPEAYLTGFERSGGAEWTSHEDEVAVLEDIAAASPRVRLETIGASHDGRPLHLATVGHPEPLDPAAIAESPSVLFTCTVHGTEPAGREACLILLRELAFSDDEWVTRILGQATVLVNPTANPDGRALNQQVGPHLSIGRTNSAGQDLNRDHLLLRHPEAFALAQVLRDHRPDIVVDVHEFQSAAASDVLWLWARSLTVGEALWRLSQDDMTRGRLFGGAARAGWSPLQYPITPNDNWEAWLPNVAGLKNQVGQLQETRRRPGVSRPGEGPANGLVATAPNQQRRVYTHLWAMREHLDYHHDNLPAIQDAIAAAEAAHGANDGPIHLDGMYDAPVTPPSNQAPTVVLDPPPCGYRLTAEQYAARDGGTLTDGRPWTSATVAERLAAHGLVVEPVGAGIVQVPLAQPLRAVVPYLLDPELDTATRPQGTPNIGMVDGAARLDDRRPTVAVGTLDTGVPNRVDAAGCSVADRIADEQSWPTHGAFVAHVDRVVRDLVAGGLLDQREAATIREVAARSGIGH